MTINLPTTMPKDQKLPPLINTPNHNTLAEQIKKICDANTYSKILPPLTNTNNPPPNFKSIHEKRISKVNPYLAATAGFAQGVGSFLLFDYNAALGTLAIIGLVFAVAGLALAFFTSISGIKISKVEDDIQKWEQNEYLRQIQAGNFQKFLEAFADLENSKVDVYSKAQKCFKKLQKCCTEYKNLINSFEVKVSLIYDRVKKAYELGHPNEDLKQIKEILDEAMEKAQDIQKVGGEIEIFPGEKLGPEDNNIPLSEGQTSLKLKKEFHENWGLIEKGLVKENINDDYHRPSSLNYLWMGDAFVGRNGMIFKTEQEAFEFFSPKPDITLNIEALNP